MQIRFSLLLLAAVATLSFSRLVWASSEVLEIGNLKQLFVDEALVARVQGARFTLNPARRAGPVIRQREAWEESGFGYCKVLRDGELFRMWYLGWEYDEEIPGYWMSRICYAQSGDGIVWKKPRLRQHEFRGSRENNILRVGFCGYGQGQDVFIDPKAVRPGERYKMIFGDFYRVFPFPDGPQRTTVSGAISPDGIHWTSVERPYGEIMPAGTDTQNVAFYDPKTGRYVAFVRHNLQERDEQGRPIPNRVSRRVARSESEDFTRFPKPVDLFGTDEKDPGGRWGSGIYNSAATLYPPVPGLYLFFPSLIRHDTGQVTIQFATSRDGRRVERRFRESYVQPDPNASRLGDQLAYVAYMGPGLTRVGDEIWMYGVEHAVPHDASWYGRRLKGSAIHRYVQRLDGFVSVDARHDPGIVTTRRFVLRGSQLELNANVAIAHAGRRHQPRSSLPYEDPGNQSSLILEVLGEDGELLARSQPLSGDGIALRPVWKGRTDLKELRGRVVQLRFTLIYAKLFAFQLVDP